MHSINYIHETKIRASSTVIIFLMFQARTIGLFRTPMDVNSRALVALLGDIGDCGLWPLTPTREAGREGNKDGSRESDRLSSLAASQS